MLLLIGCPLGSENSRLSRWLKARVRVEQVG